MKTILSILLFALLGADACNGQAKASAPSGGSQVSQAEETGVPKAFDEKPAVGTKAVCPVMGGEFTVSESTEWSKHDGKYYVFCCPGCKPQFDENPGKYIK